ncbi:MAG: site-2 protease family protein [Nitrososphaerota archaeon]
MVEEEMDILIITLIILSIFYLLLYLILWKKKFLKSNKNISLYGPALLFRTKSGRNFIEYIAKHRKFWLSYGNTAIALSFISTLIVTFMIIRSTIISFSIPPEAAIKPEMMIGLPGINPLIPFWYGIISVPIAIIIHELCHGIESRVNDININSLGIVYFILPLGAFVEPNEEELKNTSRIKRARIFAAGPIANICLAIIFLLLFSYGLMFFVSPASEGVGIEYVMDGSPASLVGLKPGMIITMINDEKIININYFQNFLSKRNAYEKIFVYTSNGEIFEIILENKYFFTKNIEDFGKGFLGVGVRDTESFLNILKKPLSNIPNSLMIFISLPLLRMSPIEFPITEFYNTPLPSNLFWILANIIYWLFWINLMFGLSNVLPAIPLDGGYIFKDSLDFLITKFFKNITIEKREYYVKMISYIVSITFLILILMQLIIPRLSAFF